VHKGAIAPSTVEEIMSMVFFFVLPFARKISHRIYEIKMAYL
jgi:hypothetical protein